MDNIFEIYMNYEGIKLVWSEINDCTKLTI